METIRTPENATKFLAILGESGSVSKACEEAGIARNSAYLWRRDDAGFKKQWDLAVEFAGDLLEAEGFRRGHDGYDKPVFQGGQLVGVVREYSDTLLIFLLKGLKRERYGDKVDHNHKVTLETLVLGNGE